MKKYLRHTCTVCKRSIDKIVDNQRVTPDSCTITLKCQGRLLPIEYRSNSEIAVNAEVGVIDWYPRNRQKSGSVSISEPELLDTSTGIYQQLVLAVPLSSAPSDTAFARLQLELRAATTKSFRQYTYRFETTFQNVAGVEAGLEKKTLRFTAFGMNPDLVEVYVNGVKQQIGAGSTDYMIYDGSPSSTVTPNTISFNSPVTLSGITQVDVVISKSQPLSTTYLDFTRNIDNEPRKSSGSWENVSYLERLVGGVWSPFYLFTCDVASATSLTLNSILVPTGQVAVNDIVATSVSLSDVQLLLARKPYSILDRYVDVAVKLDALSAERDFFKFVLVDGKPTLNITDTSVSTFYPTAKVRRFDVEPTVKTAIAGSGEQIIIDGKLIIGPE